MKEYGRAKPWATWEIPAFIYFGSQWFDVCIEQTFFLSVLSSCFSFTGSWPSWENIWGRTGCCLSMKMIKLKASLYLMYDIQCDCIFHPANILTDFAHVFAPQITGWKQKLALQVSTANIFAVGVAGGC